MTLSATFDPVVEVIVDQFSLSVHCQHNIMGLISQKKLVDVSFTRDKLLHRSVNRDGKREFHETQGKMTIVIEIWQLRSTVDAIVRACPRFRLLVLGQTGVGKSALVQHAFKINDGHISKHMRDDIDINKQFFTTDNSKFVLHDGGGFESGDNNSVSIVKDFIARRLEMPDLEDKLHAIWLCVPIPHVKECLLESGVQDFLRSRKQVPGRDIPIVVALTQLDLYDSQHSATKAGQILEDTKKILRQSCEPLEAAVDSEIPHVVVSEDAMEDTVQQLVDVTTTNVDKYVAAEAALVAMMAQQVDIGLKIKASIVIGKKRHWKCLAAGANFTGYTMWECLSAIHADIIVIWNFDDPHQDLLSLEFKQLLIRGLNNDNQLPDTTNVSDFDFGFAVVSAIVDILTPHDFAPSVSATTGAFTPAWAHEIYQPTNMTLSRTMSYIVDLTCIMQILFLLAPKWPISSSVIKLAMMAYDAASKNHVHAAIQSSVNSLVRLEGDHALSRIIELIEQHSIKASKAQDLRAKIIDMQRRLDDEWVWV
ncbi:hypothetical protein F4604DRAFT_1761481 [Suillus subluteus]|nr:hypothetical protein F4604DRAFT_1761481 [Suillus subluteus]